MADEGRNGGRSLIRGLRVSVIVEPVLPLTRDLARPVISRPL
jgi:hypothetical protein